MDLISRIEPTLGSLEKEYRLAFLKDDMRLSSIGMALWILFTISFAYNDYLFWGKSGQFWLLAFCRGVLVSNGVILLFVFKKLERVASYERLVFVFLIVAALFIFYVNTTRPSLYQMNVTLDVLIVFAIYLLFPNNLLFRTLSAFLMTLCTLLTAIFYQTFSVSPAMVTMFLSLILANAAGIIISARWNRLRRGWFKVSTQNRLAEEALRESEARYRRFFSVSPDGIMVHSDGYCILANNSAAEILGAPNPGDIIGRPIKEFVHPEYHQIVDDRIARLACGEEVAPTIEEKFIRLDGRVINVEVSTSTVPFTAGPTIQAVFRDITKRKKLQEERDRVFNLSIDMLCIAGFDGLFRQLNPAWEKTLGWSEKDLLSKPWTEFVHPDDQQVTVSATLQLVEGHPVHSFENRFQCKDGTYRWLWWTFFPLPDQELVFSVARDVTSRRQIEEEKDKILSELKNTLALVKKLSGFLPICASCKKIRNDSGYWQQVEEYVRDHSEVEFTHSICPECMAKLYPKFVR